MSYETMDFGVEAPARIDFPFEPRSSQVVDFHYKRRYFPIFFTRPKVGRASIRRRGDFGRRVTRQSRMAGTAQPAKRASLVKFQLRAVRAWFLGERSPRRGDPTFPHPPSLTQCAAGFYFSGNMLK